MEKGILSDNHRRSVSSSMHIIEKMLLEIEKVISSPDKGVLSKVVNDMPDLDAEHYTEAIAKIKKELNSISAKYNLRTEEIMMSRLVNSRKAKMWETINDTFSRKLKGYKEFPKETAEEFDSDISRLRKLIEEL
jgi:neutral trehalase